MSKGTGRWTALVATSFLVHAALTVNTTETALWNAQGQQGSLLAQQLADAAAPLVISRDMVSLSVLTTRYEHHPGIASVRIFSSLNERLSETGMTNDDGRLFTAPMQLQQQAVGQVDLRLITPSKGDIIRASLGNTGISALLHLLILAGALFMTRTAPTATRGATSSVGTAPRPAPSAQTAAVEQAAEVPVTAGSHLHIALDDPNGLLRRVNVAMADEMLTVFDQLVDRVARLYGGEVATPFGPEGVVVHFREGLPEERPLRALAAAQLFLQLVNDAASERRSFGRLSLPCKAGLIHEEQDPDLAGVLARMAPADRILTSIPAPQLDLPCHLGTAYRLAVSEQTSVQVALVEGFATEYQELIVSQSQHILAPAETA